MEAVKLEKNFFNIKVNKKIGVIISMVVLVAIGFLIVLPFALSNVHSGADYPYHLSVIMSLNEAWENGSFWTKIVELIGNDYGYGTGIFYTLIPAGIAVFFMNILHLNLTGALYIEFALLFTLSAIVVFLFFRKVFKNNFTALILAIVYILFPYFFQNLYYRFAFSEIFFMLYIPMIAWGLYELLENNNYKSFLFLFTLGVTLAILTHVTLLVFVAVISAVYILINIKKLFKNYNYVPFLISCFIILLLSACFYIPLLVNYGVVNLADMKYDMSIIYEHLLHNFTVDSWLFINNILISVVFVLFSLVFIRRCVKREVIKEEISFYILSAIAFIISTPLFPWSIMPKFLGIIQFVHRLLMLSSLLYVLQIGYIIKKIDKRLLKLILVCLLLSFLIFACCNISRSAWNKISSAYAENVVLDQVTGFDINNGLGYAKNGDYYPTGAIQEYVFNRANGNIIFDTDLEIREFANYQSKHQISFIVTPTDGNYVVVNIPYNVIKDTEIYQVSSSLNNEFYEVNINEFAGDSSKSKIVLSQTNVECKVVALYEQDGILDNYLSENPFEFIVLEGDASFTNFVKTNVTTYSVDILVTTNAKIELPTLFYKGYMLTYTDLNGNVENIVGMHGSNGFMEIEVNKSGTLNVVFNPTYITASNIISIVGAVLFAIVLLCVLLVPRKFFTKIGDKITEFLRTHKTVAEILRFLIVGGIATLMDMFTMGVVMYFMQKSIYPSFINVFINSPTPSTLATIIGTTVGFVTGLIVNYILSILFVFNEKGNSKTFKGFVVFCVLSAIGLVINIIGTYIGFDLLHLNQWLVKIIMIVIVLIYNYISKKLVLFKNKDNNKKSDKETL